MSTLAHSLQRRHAARPHLLTDVLLVVLGSLLVAGLAQLYITLPFTPVPITGQTLGVLVVGAGLGATRGASALLLYLVWGAIGLPFFSEGRSGVDMLAFASATGGYLWGFVIASAVVGKLAEKGWDKNMSSSLGAMLVGEIIIFTCGVAWLANALQVPVLEALELGLYPFVVGDVIKLLLAAALLPGAWKLRRLVGR